MPQFTLTVNGEERTVDVAADTPLLWVLRDVLTLTGTKYGCGIGACGACTVHLDGAAAKSCSLNIESVSGQQITTIEGLSVDGSHPVQQAWDEFNVPQCGYCQAGQIMNAVDLIKNKPRPTDEDIDALQTGNICRCGTYDRIRAAIKHAAELAR